MKNHELPKGKEDVNAKGGRGRVGSIVGPFGVLETNERRDRWIG